MTGIIFDIKRFAVHDGPGIRTTVFFKGCPLRCSWCHNPESIDQNFHTVEKTTKMNGRIFKRVETIGFKISVASLFAELHKERIFMEESGGGVTFSGGEPLQQYHFLMEMLKICNQYGIHTAVDTSLYASWEKICAIAKLSDLFLVDLKLMDRDAHRKHTGVYNDLILDNIKKLSTCDVSMRIRVPLIPGVNTSEENLRKTISFLHALNSSLESRKKIKTIDLLPFHNNANEKYKRIERDNPFVKIKSIHKGEILEIEKLFTNAGFTTNKV